jgi:dephospho-CoA kinase
MRIVGITWTNGAGKGTVVNYMVTHMWFTHFSVRAYLEEELIRRWLPIDRNQTRILADGLRKEFGPSYVVDQVFQKASALGKDAILESLRCVGEIEKLRKYKDFFLLGVDAERKTRYERVVLRWSDLDKVTYEQFVAQENREIYTSNPYEMNLRACLELADVVIYNDGTTQQLYLEVERALAA